MTGNTSCPVQGLGNSLATDIWRWQDPFAIGCGTGRQSLIPLRWPGSDLVRPTQTVYVGVRLDMSYTRTFLAYPEIVEEISNLLRNKHVQWGIENEMNDKRSGEIAGAMKVEVGQATLTVDTSESNLRKDLDDLISKLEKVHDRTQDDGLLPL
jgi:hypothetical protein